MVDNTELTTASIKSLITEEIKIQISQLKNIIYAFLAGTVIFLFAGLSFKDVFLLPLMQYAYPPSNIYKEIKESIKDDISIEKIDKLKKEIKSEVWDALKSGNELEYENLVSQDNFYNSLEQKFDNEVINAFGVPGSVFPIELNKSEKLKQAILKMGGEYQRADIRVVSPTLNNETTFCGRRFEHNKLHAIIRIPESANREKYGWLRCIGVGAPNYLIKIMANGKELGGINLISIERDGKNDSLELKISQSLAKQLDLPDWQSYKSRIVGSYKIQEVFWE